MPKLTIDLSDEAYALLWERAQDEGLGLESETVLSEGIALRSAV